MDVVAIARGAARDRMSLVNKVLQDLEARNASAEVDARLGTNTPRGVSEIGSEEWFWRIVAALMFCAVAGVAWVAYQLRLPPPLATDLAYRAAEEGRLRSGKLRESAAVPSPAEPQVAPEPVASTTGERELPAQAPSQSLRLARFIESPIPERTTTPADASPPSATSEAQARFQRAMEEAINAYRAALGESQEGARAWLGLAVSYETLGRKAEAAEAFRRALASGSLGVEDKAYAEQRVQRLEQR